MTRHAPIRKGLASAAVVAALLVVTACQAGAPTGTTVAATATAAAEPTGEPAVTASSSGAPSPGAVALSPTGSPTMSPTDSPTVPTAVAASSRAVPSTSPVGTGAGGPGSLTVAITAPVAVAGHVNTEVSCQTHGARYVATAGGSIQGYTVNDVVRVAGYHGPGSYPALVTMSITGPQANDAVSAVPATAEITAAGGNISFSAATDTGRTLAGTIAWACSA
ncbi:hypothetical protein [Frankia sp. AgKG'84/4]|uniref:hypothetical protein n=1 Tax=Frankia sp. AgKG'84/4 TaxID=573490 RepID=UPI00200BA36E|nr:hypothetical protein [Frankia sp. AgKG'84/4]MCL9793644.1 hypothetical protein [Frankia sp. AgKG'84/4]